MQWNVNVLDFFFIVLDKCHSVILFHDNRIILFLPYFFYSLKEKKWYYYIIKINSLIKYVNYCNLPRTWFVWQIGASFFPWKKDVNHLNYRSLNIIKLKRTCWGQIFFKFLPENNWNSMSYKIIHPTRCYPTIITSRVTCIRQKKNPQPLLPFRRVYQHRSLNKVLQLSSWSKCYSAHTRTHIVFASISSPGLKAGVSSSSSGGRVTWYRASAYRQWGMVWKKRQGSQETKARGEKEKEKAGKPHGSRG